MTWIGWHYTDRQQLSPKHHAWPRWCRRRGCKRTTQNLWFGENPGKICGNLGKLCENVRRIAVCALKFQKWHPESKCRRLLWRSSLYLVILGKLGEIWASLGEIWAKMVLEVCFDLKNAPNMKRNAIVFFCGSYILWSSFVQVWGNLGKNPSYPQKFACSYTYVSFHQRLSDSQNVCLQF